MGVTDTINKTHRENEKQLVVKDHRRIGNFMQVDFY